MTFVKKVWASWLGSSHLVQGLWHLSTVLEGKSVIKILLVTFLPLLDLSVCLSIYISISLC